MKYFLLFVLSFYSATGFSLVDAKNGNYSKTFTDFKIQSSALPLELSRTYNSRSLYTGMFGVGWCSNVETKLDILPDGTPRVVVCGGGLEVVFLTKNKKQNVDVQVQRIISVLQKQNKKLTKPYLSELSKKLKRSKVLRNEFLRAYRIKGSITPGQVYFAEGRKNDVLIYNKKNKHFKRALPSGVQEFYDSDTGRLVQISDRIGNYVKNSWKNGRLQSIMDNRGQKVQFSYDKNQGCVSKATQSGKVLASYKCENNSLVEVKNQDGMHTHKYDDLYNLIQTKYPADKKSKKKAGSEKLTYDTKKDWVTSFRNQRKCLETYKYEVNPNNPDHYWTKVQKQCGKVITNNSRYEFWNKRLADGSRYLHRARQDINGRVKDVTYHPVFKRAMSVTRGTVRTEYDFFKSGLIKAKQTPTQRVDFVKYNSKCRKPSSVLVNRLSQGKVISKQSIDIQYDDVSCFMSKVTRSDGRWVKLHHDSSGRINKLNDQSGRSINVDYSDRFNKPVVLAQKGVGAVTLQYDSQGRSKGFKEGSNPVVIAQVMRVYNGFLEIMSPIINETNI